MTAGTSRRHRICSTIRAGTGRGGGAWSAIGARTEPAFSPRSLADIRRFILDELGRDPALTLGNPGAEAIDGPHPFAPRYPQSRGRKIVFLKNMLRDQLNQQGQDAGLVDDLAVVPRSHPLDIFERMPPRDGGEVLQGRFRERPEDIESIDDLRFAVAAERLVDLRGDCMSEPVSVPHRTMQLLGEFVQCPQAAAQLGYTVDLLRRWRWRWRWRRCVLRFGRLRQPAVIHQV